jgi:hypothetical protein
MFKIFELLTEIIGWLLIVASPLFIGIGIGALIYISNPTTLSLILGISITAFALTIGIIWATKIWKTKEGTMWFLSRVMATPDLDKSDKETDEK